MRIRSTFVAPHLSQARCLAKAAGAVVTITSCVDSLPSWHEGLATAAELSAAKALLASTHRCASRLSVVIGGGGPKEPAVASSRAGRAVAGDSQPVRGPRAGH